MSLLKLIAVKLPNLSVDEDIQGAQLAEGGDRAGEHDGALVPEDGSPRVGCFYGGAMYS
jgi:hypothetical protein